MWRTTGHDKAIRSLERALAEDRLAHSYLVTGQKQVGKTTLAFDIARALNCLSDDRPCGECRQCERISSGLHPDVRLIGLETARSGRLRTLISIDQVREVQRDASLLPYEGRSRVFIFESAEKLSEEAANSLLKTLEEPPESVVIILLASDAGAVLPTILSRCRRVDLRPVPAQTIADFLSESGATDPDHAREIAGLAAGRIGWAIEAAEDPSLLESISETLDVVEEMLAAPLTDRFDYAERLAGRFSADREGVFAELDLWLSWWRDALLTGQRKPELIVNASRADKFASVAESVPAESVTATLNALRRAKFLLERNVTPRLAIESVMLTLPASG